MMRLTCKNCQKAFRPIRAGAQYCSGACRVAAHRKRQAPKPRVVWEGKVPGMRQAKADLADRLLEIAGQEDNGMPKTGRRYYYLALSHGYINPDMGASDAAKKERDAAYKQVTEVLGTLRKSDWLGWDMVLDLTRDLDKQLTYGSPREARASTRQIYDEDRWLGQQYFPIMIVEKDTMEPVCKPIADRWQMPFASSRGYGSLTLQHDVAQLLQRRHAQTGQSAIILFLSDHDPSGHDLERAWRQAMEDFGVWGCIFVRIALTAEQVADPDLDLDRLSIEVKPSDSRSKAFIDQYGDRCWEADVLPAAVIGAAIDANIESWLDAKQWKRRSTEIERARLLL